MIASALAALSLAALPQGAVRYRAELAGEPIGVAEVRIGCRAMVCAVTYESRLRLPAESGGEIERRGVEVEVDQDGRWRGGRLRAGRGGELRDAAGVADAVPAALLEIVLAAEAGGAERCVPSFDEENPAVASACVRRDAAGRAVAETHGIREVIVPGADGFPAEVVVEGRMRFIRDAAAAVPARAPRLAGTRVAGPDDPAKARSFCGVALDAAPRAAAFSGLPAPRAAGASCREKTAAYLEAAHARGLEARTAVGVAWDGGAFVWHAWAELRSGGAWVPVDPSFGQLPARGPRFTLGRYAADAAERSAAGARILACWGTARVEGPR